MKQYVDRPNGEPAYRQACRSAVSAVAVEAFVDDAGYEPWYNEPDRANARSAP